MYLARFVWLDGARGVAVFSMFVAHVAPGGGVILLSEFLTAPLFALLVVVSLTLSWRNRRTTGLRWYAVQVARGGVLVILGMLLQLVYGQIAVVLQALGVLTIIAAAIVPIVVARPVVCLVGSLASAVFTPLVISIGHGLGVQGAFAGWWVDILVTGRAYRVFTFLGYGLLGVALVEMIRRLESVRMAAMSAIAATVVAAGILVVDQLTAAALRTYAGTTRETLFSMCLAAAVVFWCVVVERALGAARADRILAPLTATGRMALTAYTLQIVFLRVVTDVFLDGGRDDHWWLLGALTVIVVGFCWAWERSGWPRPVEALLRLPQKVLVPTRLSDGPGGTASRRG